MANEEDVRRIALSLPGATEGEDRLAFEVGGKGFAWSWKERVEKKKPRVERRDILAIRTANENDKQALIAANPRIYFTEDHYNGFPAVLVRLSEIEADELEELLIDAWHTKAPKALIAAYAKDRRSGSD